MKKIAVIGAGPAGLTAAYKLCEAGYNVNVFEAGNSVGGMCKTLNLWGYKADMGPHRFFSKDKVVNHFWLDMTNNEYNIINRKTRIFYSNRFYNYPVSISEILKKTGIFSSMQILFSYLNQKRKRQVKPENFEDWVIQNFGVKLYQMFFKTYSEKLWGVPCSQIDSDFAAQRIKKFNLKEAVVNAFGFIPGKKHNTLIDSFYYPAQGTGMVYENMAEKIREMGGNIHLNRPLIKISYPDENVLELRFSTGKTEHFDNMISSMPLTTLLKILPNVPENVLKAANQLTFRNTILVYLLVDKNDLFPDNWLYIHDSEITTGRITNFRNWSPGLYGKNTGTVLSLEYWCDESDNIWQEDDDKLFQLAKKDLEKTGLDKDATVLESHVERIPKCYPIYKKGYKKMLKPVTAFLKNIQSIQAIGRYGSFKYNNQDHSILMGMLAAENLTYGAKHDLWEINTDYESYFEKEASNKT